MSITNAQRREIHKELAAATSPTTADALMDLLPPVDWTEVATKSDLVQQDAAMDARFAQQDTAIEARFAQQDAAMEARFGAFHEEMSAGFAELHLAMSNFEVRLLHEQRTFTFAMIGALAAIATVAFAVIGMR